MKKKIIFVVLFFVLIPFIYVITVLKSNSKYMDNIYNDIMINTNLKDISYVNLENNYYVVKSKNKVYVFDINYNIISNYDLSKLKKSNMDLVYKRNNLYYVTKVVNDKSIIYNYFDIYSLDKKFDIVIGG